MTALSSIKVHITHDNIILTLSILVFRQHHDLLAADSRPAAPHLELVFADYADVECGQSCLEYVSLLPYLTYNSYFKFNSATLSLYVK